MYPYFSKNENVDEDIVENNVSKSDLDDKEDILDKDDFRAYIIEALQEAIEDQQENVKLYEKIYNMITDEKDKNVLRQIYLNEMKYEKIFIEIYKMLTGKEPVIRPDEDVEIDIDDSLKEELEDAIEEQLEDIEFYRMLMSAFVDLPVRDMIYEVILGKQKNAQLLSNLYNKYR